MKRFVSFVLAACLLATSGCISTHVVKNKAQTHWEYDPEGKHSHRVEGKPGYYALLPLTAAADATTYPFQIIFLSGASPRDTTVQVYGWPIPVPVP